MDITKLTKKQQVLLLAALDYFLIENYNGSPLEDLKFDLLEARIVNIYDINKDNNVEKTDEMKKDMEKIRDLLIDKLL